MERRLELQAILETLLGSDEVYFQPPEDIKISYPAIVYNQDQLRNQHADNLPYRQTKRYSVTVIDRDPDSPTSDKVAALPHTSFNRRFVVDNLNHYAYSLYF